MYQELKRDEFKSVFLVDPIGLKHVREVSSITYSS